MINDMLSTKHNMKKIKTFDAYEANIGEKKEEKEERSLSKKL